MEIIGNHVNIRNHWQATSTGLLTQFMYCSLYHFKMLNWESEILMSQMSFNLVLRRDFYQFHGIAAQP